MSTSYHFKPIVTDGIILHFDALNTKSYSGGTYSVTDLSGKNNTGIFANMTLTSDNSFVFDGVDDYIDVATTYDLELVGGGGCISSWVKLYSTLYSNIVYKADNYTNGYFSWVAYDKVVASVYPTAPSYYILTTTQSIYPDIWYNITMNWDSTSLEIYINDYVESLSPGPTVTASGNPLYVGSSTTGEISNVKIYNRKLSVAEVLQNYNALKNRYTQ